MRNKKRENSNIRKDVLKILDNAFPDEEAEKPVPWLQPGEEVCIETLPDEVIKLKNAFFFRGVF